MCPKNFAKKISEKKLTTIEIKKEITDKHEKGTRVVDLACQYDRSTSMICTILKKKEDIKDNSKGCFQILQATHICPQRDEKFASPLDEREATHRGYDCGDHHLPESTKSVWRSSEADP